MMLEAVSSPIRYSWPRGEIRFVPGAPVQVHEFRGSRILRKCGDKIRVVANQLNPQPERFWIEVNSPSFGWYEAEMLRDDGATVFVFHPHLVREVAVPSLWIAGEETNPRPPLSRLRIRAKIVGAPCTLPFMQGSRRRMVSNGDIVRLNAEQFWAVRAEAPFLLTYECPCCKGWYDHLFQLGKSRMCVHCVEWRAPKRPRTGKKK